MYTSTDYTSIHCKYQFLEIHDSNFNVLFTRNISKSSWDASKNQNYSFLTRTFISYILSANITNATKCECKNNECIDETTTTSTNSTSTSSESSDRRLKVV